ncbi:MAG: hypothetical protein AAGJ50_12525 [Pseudomonadota bacterium]
MIGQRIRQDCRILCILAVAALDLGSGYGETGRDDPAPSIAISIQNALPFYGEFYSVPQDARSMLELKYRIPMDWRAQSGGEEPIDLWYGYMGQTIDIPLADDGTLAWLPGREVVDANPMLYANAAGSEGALIFVLEPKLIPWSEYEAHTLSKALRQANGMTRHLFGLAGAAMPRQKAIAFNVHPETEAVILNSDGTTSTLSADPSGSLLYHPRQFPKAVRLRLNTRPLSIAFAE